MPYRLASGPRTRSHTLAPFPPHGSIDHNNAHVQQEPASPGTFVTAVPRRARAGCAADTCARVWMEHSEWTPWVRTSRPRRIGHAPCNDTTHARTHPARRHGTAAPRRAQAPQLMHMPPSTLRCAPVTKLASSLARKRAACATSAGAACREGAAPRHGMMRCRCTRQGARRHGAGMML